MNSEKIVEIFTDGACRGNPGPGGWGAVLRYGRHEKHLSGAEEQTTNNRMELTAVIKSLAHLKKGCAVRIVTDSQYVHLGITKWFVNWQRNGWKNSQKEPVKNQDLWQELALETRRHRVEWRWIKGHSGHAENELADELARMAIDAR